MDENGEFIPGLSRREFLAVLASAAIGGGGAIPHPKMPQVASLVDALGARASPAALAIHTSNGRWRLAPHLALLNRLVLTLAARQKKRILVTFPPRHGKSSFLSRYVPAWWLGTYPDQRVMLTSYGADLAFFWSNKAKETLAAFGPKIWDVNVKGNAAEWSIIGREGGCRAAGVDGPITGFGADLLISDDLLKSSAEAQSEVMRERTWEWFIATAYTRLEPGGVAIMIATRWHEDDPIGRIISKMRSNELEQWELFNFPAIAEEDEPAWPLSIGRRKGAALWPERYDEKALALIKQAVSDYWWSALYQQRPVPKGGGMFKEHYFNQRKPVAPFHADRVRYWDRAATPDGGCLTAGVLMSKDTNGYYIEHVKSGQWEPIERDEYIVAMAHRDRDIYGERHEPTIYLEHEPGSSGVDAYKHTAAKLAGFKVRPNRPSGDKETRAEPWSSQLAAKNVYVIEDGSWDIGSYVSEHCSFPLGKFKDRVDASSGAFNILSNPRKAGTVYALPVDTRRFDVKKQKVGLSILSCSETQFQTLSINGKFLAIRIADEPLPPPPEKLDMLEVLNLSFRDFDMAKLPEYGETILSLPDGNIAAKMVCMNHTHGRDLWKFLIKRDRKVEPDAIVITSSNGVGRAPSIAYAICDTFRWSRGVITNLLEPEVACNGNPPNQYIYDLVRESRGRIL